MGKKIVMIVLSILVFLCCYPVIFLMVGSFMGQSELQNNLAAIMAEGSGYAKWSLMPWEPTFRSYIELLIDSPGFFVMFWNSVKMAGGVLLGQLFISIPAAWGFAKYRFPFHRALFMTYIVLMMMPFQVVMLSNYLVLNQLHLLDTVWSIILPGVFSTFPIFIMYNFFRGIHASYLEAARIDGASELQIFFKIGVPLGSSGIISALVLGFLEYWNLIEQPMTFLKDKTLWPLSLFLPTIEPERAGIAFVASIITLIPAMLVFFSCQDYLEQGIASLGIKE